MFKMYQEIKAQVGEKCPELSYIYWDLNQFDDADSGIVPPALLINISVNWRGNDGEANVGAKLWIMDYSRGAWEDDDAAAYALAYKVLGTLCGIHGSHFNHLQQVSEELLPGYKGLAIGADFQCNVRR